MSEDATTKPTLETVLERVNALGELVTSLREDVKAVAEETRGEMKSFREEIRGEIKDFREEFRNEFKGFREEVENRLDRVESMTNMTRSEMLTLRMDFREIRAHIRQTA